MVSSKGEEYVILRDREPVKFVFLSPEFIQRFCVRLSRRYPEHRWSVASRFLAQGAD